MASFPENFQPRLLTYSTYDEPRYSRILVIVRRTLPLPAFLPYFTPFGVIEEVWAAHCDLSVYLEGPVFVKFARSSQALRALEAFRGARTLEALQGAPAQAFPRFSQIYLAQSRVPWKSREMEMDLQKLTVIHVTIPRCFTENVLVDTFKVYGVVVSCFIIRIEFGKSEDLAYIGFSTPSQAALAIEECDKRFQAIWAEAKHDLLTHPDLRFGVYGTQQGTTKHEVQGATLNTMCQSTSLAKIVTEPSKVSESKSSVNNPKQKTTCEEEQENSLNTLGKSTSLAKVVIEPSKLSESKSDANNSKPKTTSNEVQSSANTSGKDTKLVKPAMKPVAHFESKIPVNNSKHKTTINYIQGRKSTSRTEMVTKPSKLSESNSLVASPKHKTTSNEVEVSSSNTLGKDTKRVKPAMKPAAHSESKFPVNNPKYKTTNNEVEVSSSNTLSKRSKWDQQPTAPSVICTERKTVTSEMHMSNLIPVVSRTTLNVPVNRAESEPDGTEQNTITHRIPGSNLIILGFRASEDQQVFKPSEHDGYKYYVGDTDYSAALFEPEPSGSNLDDYYYTSGVEQQTDDHSVKESNLMTSGYSTHLPVSVTKPLEPNVCPIYENTTEPEAKGAEVQQDTVHTTERSLKSSEWKFYMGGARRKKRSQGNSLLTLVEPPDLASVERSNTRKQESISRHLLMISEFPLTQEQIFGLFDVIPGLESCETRLGLRSRRVYAMIQYRNVASAVYAKHRLNDLEYPLGNQLHVSFMEDKIHGTRLLQEMATQLVNSYLASVVCDNNWAPQLLRTAESWIPPPRLRTDAALPSYKRKAPPDSSIRERLLIIFDPCPLPQNVLDNVLSRFGNFIACHLIPGKNGAYAMFAERASASDAIAMLHGKTVNDVKLKVTLSDLPTNDFSKLQRLF